MDPPNLLVDQGVCCAMSLLVVSETKPMKSHQHDHPSMSGARTASIDIQSGREKPEGLNPIPRWHQYTYQSGREKPRMSQPYNKNCRTSVS